MSEPIPKNQFGTGAGKGDDPRPVDRVIFRKNFDAIKKGKPGAQSKPRNLARPHTPINFMTTEKKVAPHVRKYLSDIGKKGGSVKGGRKALSAITNGMKGGRPRKLKEA